jgi:hypothetical protein
MRDRRLAFVQRYRHANHRNWLFTDEKTFHLFGQPKNEFIWERLRTNVGSRPTVKHSPKLHVWGGVSYYGRTQLYIFEENLTADLYIQILETRLPEDIPHIFTRQWTFQQDGDPKHTSNRVQKWLSEHVPRFIHKNEWPANSPDLNVIENLWSILQDRVYAREPRTLAQLRQIIEEEWNNIDPGTLRNLVNSVPRRFDAVQLNHGGSTGY